MQRCTTQPESRAHVGPAFESPCAHPCRCPPQRRPGEASTLRSTYPLAAKINGPTALIVKEPAWADVFIEYAHLLRTPQEHFRRCVSPCIGSACKRERRLPCLRASTFPCLSLAKTRSWQLSYETISIAASIMAAIEIRPARGACHRREDDRMSNRTADSKPARERRVRSNLLDGESRVRRLRLRCAAEIAVVESADLGQAHDASLLR